MFDLELLQAINDWMRGGDLRQKTRRGRQLKAVAAKLPERYKRRDGICFRQLALDNSAVWRIGTEFTLAETISSWTESEKAARDFKGGVPPLGYQGAIFSVLPGKGQTIMNLVSVFADPQFAAAVDTHRAQIDGFGEGIGKYGDTQLEVVIEVETLPLASIHAWGGYSGTSGGLGWLLELLGHKSEPRWLKTRDAIERVEAAIREVGPVLKEIRRLQSES